VIRKENAGQSRNSKPGYEGVQKLLMGMLDMREVVFIMAMFTVEVEGGMESRGGGLGAVDVMAAQGLVGKMVYEMYEAEGFHK